MHSIPFFKYQGTGNDFILIDQRENSFPFTKELIAQMCHRRFGIGADGLILLENHPDYDFKMLYFNADGKEGSMCGNGGRCIVRFAADLGICKEKAYFIAVDGPHLAYIQSGQIQLKMQEVKGVDHQNENYYFLNTGSPHYVEFVEKINAYPVLEKGKIIRYSPQFAPSGTNVNFVEVMEDQSLFVRTYERGVEDETFSCGTGVTASALVASLRGMKSPVQILTLGGKLKVTFDITSDGGFQNIFLAGPAERVFQGEYVPELKFSES